MEKVDGLECSQITYILPLITRNASRKRHPSLSSIKMESLTKPLLFLMKMKLQNSRGDPLAVRSLQDGAGV